MIRRPYSDAQLNRLYRNSPEATRGLTFAAFKRCAQLTERAHRITNEAADKAEAREKTAMRAADLTADEAADKIRGANTRVVEMKIRVSTDQARAALAQALKEHNAKLQALGHGLVLAAARISDAEPGAKGAPRIRSAARELLRVLDRAAIDALENKTVGETIAQACDTLRELLESSK